MTALNPKFSLTILMASLALAACSEPNSGLQEKIAQAEAAAQRAEAAAAKAEKALAEMEKPSEAPTMVDGGPQLTPEPPPQPMVQSAQDQGPAEGAAQPAQ